MKNKNYRHTEHIKLSDSRKDRNFAFSNEYYPNRLYAQIRKKVPVIDAAIMKTVRLTGGFRVISDDESMQKSLDDFVENVPVGLTRVSLFSFIDTYLESLLTYGNSVGEIVYDKNGYGIAGLFNIDPCGIEIRSKSPKEPFEKRIFIHNSKEKIEIKYPQRILFSALNPQAGKVYGESVLAGLPCLSGILLRIYECIGQNYDRIGNVRYAITYNPQDADERSYAGERVEKIAKEWSDGMKASACGEVRDFIASGNVDIKVIGADNPLIDTEVPVRQLLEQITAKLGIPPFLLGLSWSTTERMSQQQCDILTSELEYYRRLLTSVIKKICTAYLRLSGSSAEINVEWDNINLLDETELANARLANARAIQIENQTENSN